MKLKKSTVFILVLSWILFFAICFLVFIRLNEAKQSKITNEKIFQKGNQIESTTEKKIVDDHENVVIFMKKYYQYLQKGNETALGYMVEDTKTFHKSQTVKKLKRYIEAYNNLSFTVEDGIDASSYIVYATYDTKIKDIKTLVPGLTQYYVVKKDDSFVVYNNESHYTEEIKSALKANMQKDKIHNMITTSNAAYEEALKKDKELKDFFKSSNS